MAIRGISDLRKKIAYTHGLISTAYHEAGHVVYGLLKGFKIDSVIIFENKNNKRIDGATYYSDPPFLENNTDFDIKQYFLREEVCLRYAGLVSEKCHFKKISGTDRFPLFLRDGSSDDTLFAASIIKTNNLAPPGKKRYALKKKLIKTTQNHIEEHWDAVTAVAHELFNKKKLSFDDLRSILIKNTDSKKFWKEQFNNISKIYEKSVSIDKNNIKYILSL